MKRKAIILILDISESINDIGDYLKNFDKGRFLKDKRTQDAIVRRLEIIGEATKKLPLDFRKNMVKFHGKIWLGQGTSLFMTISE